jgi:hypothetical protein
MDSVVNLIDHRGRVGCWLGDVLSSRWWNVFPAGITSRSGGNGAPVDVFSGSRTIDEGRNRPILLRSLLLTLRVTTLMIFFTLSIFLLHVFIFLLLTLISPVTLLITLISILLLILDFEIGALLLAIIKNRRAKVGHFKFFIASVLVLEDSAITALLDRICQIIQLHQKIAKVSSDALQRFK